jgi:hypothetical protein
MIHNKYGIIFGVLFFFINFWGALHLKDFGMLLMNNDFMFWFVIGFVIGIPYLMIMVGSLSINKINQEKYYQAYLIKRGKGSDDEEYF